MLDINQAPSTINRLQLIKIDYQALINKNIIKLGKMISRQGLSKIKYIVLALTYQGKLVINPAKTEYQHLLGIVQPLVEDTKALFLIKSDSLLINSSYDAKVILQAYCNILRHYQQQEQNADNEELSFIDEKYYLFTPHSYINWIAEQLPTLPYRYIGEFVYAKHDIPYLAMTLFSKFNIANLLAKEDMLDRIVYTLYTARDEGLLNKTDINNLYVRLLIKLVNRFMHNSQNGELIEIWNAFTTKL